MNNKLKEITEVIQKAVPEIILGEHKHFQGPDAPPLIETECRDIALEDVLRAIEFEDNYSVIINQNNILKICSRNSKKEIECEWQLGKPLHLQKPEVWDLLHDLLVKKI